MDEIDSLKLRYRCSECKNLESHHASNKKRKCENCGTVLTEITEKDYRYYKKKKKEKKKEDEDKKEKEKEKKKKKHEKEDDDDSSEKEEKKHKHKLKKNLSTKNLEDKNYKLKKESKEEGDSPRKNSSKKEKKKKRNRYRSLEKLGPVLNRIVSKALKGEKGVEKEMNKLNKINFDGISNKKNNYIEINHSNDQPTQVFINDKEVTHIVDTDVFEPLFNTLNNVFKDNFFQNFISSNTTNFFNNVQSIIEDNERYALENGSVPIKEESISKLKQFKLSNKYCKKDKDGKYELPVCCICLSEIKKGKETTLLECMHMFHSKCCLNWLKKNNTCPMCRQVID